MKRIHGLKLFAQTDLIEVNYQIVKDQVFAAKSSVPTKASLSGKPQILAKAKSVVNGLRKKFFSRWSIDAAPLESKWEERM